MNKGALFETLETALVVTAITVLIWLFAEGETILTETKTVKIQFVAPNANMAVQIVGEGPGVRDQLVSVSFQVSRSNHGKITQFLQEQQTIKLEVPDPGDGDLEQDIDLRDQLSDSQLADRGAYIQSTDPPTSTVRLIELRTITMPIKSFLGDLELSEEDPKFEPAEVEVTLPKYLADLAENSDLSLYALMNEFDDSEFQEDIQEVRKVRLGLPPELESEHAKINPKAQVRVTFFVRKSTSELTLDGVQVHVDMSAEWTGGPHVTINTQRFIEVKLKGPAEVINRIKETNDLVWPSIRLKSEDLTEGDQQAPLHISVPEGVTIISPLPLQTMIDYTVSPIVETP